MTEMQNLAALEAAHGGPFRFRHAGQEISLRGPQDLSLDQVLAILEMEHLPGIPGMPRWKRDRLFRAWVAHHDLPDLNTIRRLAYVVDRYRNDLEVDLQAEYHVDLQQLWLERRWRYLLNLIDHLPQNTWYHQAVLNDPEHVQMLAEAQARAQDATDTDKGERPSPPQKTWSPEVEAATKITDAIHSLNHTLIAVNSEKGKTPRPPAPEPRPKSLLDKLRKAEAHKIRYEKHKSLANRMLPHKSRD